jgi:hypothetical protein
MMNSPSDKVLVSYIPDYYQKITVEEVRKDEASIIEVLSAIMDNTLPNDLILLNYYKEIPIRFGATVEFIDRGVVDMVVHRLQAVAMLMQNFTCIKSNHLPHCAIAKVLKVKKEKNLVFLTQFSYVQIPSERRMYIRVKVSDRFEAVFHSNQQVLRGAIGDISYGGVAILAPAGSPLEENAKGKVSLWLPNIILEVPGKFLRVDDDNLTKKYIFEMEVDAKSERIISQFIFKQQIKILRELKELCL